MARVPGASRKRRRGRVDECANYLLAYKLYLYCPRYLEQGWPIATGVIEGGGRHLINDRLDIAGARWGLAGAEAVLKLHALTISGDFAEYWTFHEARERERTHLPRYASRRPPPVHVSRQGCAHLRVVA